MKIFHRAYIPFISDAENLKRLYVLSALNQDQFNVLGPDTILYQWNHVSATPKGPSLTSLWILEQTTLRRIFKPHHL